jgi:DNA topoisomerase VI subunit B
MTAATASIARQTPTEPPIIYPGKSAPEGGADFTKEMREVPVKRALPANGYGAKKALAARLLEKGVTAKEMLKALGWPAISMPAMARSVGMKLEKTKEGRVTRYKGIPLGIPLDDEEPTETRKLTRVPFTVSRLMEFCTRRELVNQTGHDVSEWPLVVLKELIDNALDACEEVGVAPVITVQVDGDEIAITDNGPGIPASVIDGVLDYSIRVSSREAYVSPTRGAQGNALKTIMPMGYVLDERGEAASSVTLIEAHGVLHRVKFCVDHIRQEPKITRIERASPVTVGTKVTVKLPRARDDGYDLFEYNKTRLTQLATAFTWVNPHLSLRLIWNGQYLLNAKATDPNWQKWMPSWPTSVHWYDLSRFRRYMAAHIAHSDKTTVREFVTEFDGMSGTAKQKAVLAETDSSYMSLHRYFGVQKAKAENIENLLAAIKRHTKPVRPAALGIIGQPHLFARMEAAGGEPKTFKYVRSFGVAGGLPRVVEYAFGIHRGGLTEDGSGPRRMEISGVNWSPGIRNPFLKLGRGGESLDSVLAGVRANTEAPIISMLHVACPRIQYTDRGKSAIVVEGED